MAEIRETYRARRDALTSGLAEVGWKVPLAAATMFVWAQVPLAMSSVDFSLRLLERAKVAVAPGVGFGPGGEGFVRFALVEEVDRTLGGVPSHRRRALNLLLPLDTIRGRASRRAIPRRRRQKAATLRRVYREACRPSQWFFAGTAAERFAAQPLNAKADGRPRDAARRAARVKMQSTVQQAYPAKITATAGRAPVPPQ